MELLMKQRWLLAVWKVVQISQDWTKMFPIIKYHARREDIRDAWIRAIAWPVLPKAVVCSDHFSKDSFDESQELKQSLLGSNLRGASLLRVLCVNVNMMLSFKTSTPMPIKILQHKPPTNTYQRWKLRVIYTCILHTR